jgi:CheY-like chemotaxis protein
VRADDTVRILVVDDDHAIREVLRLALEEDGYLVEEAANGVAALAVLSEPTMRYVVLLDYRMPRLNGGAVLDALEEDGRLDTQHAVLLLTANLNTLPLPLLQQVERLGVPILSKPFNVDEVLDAVEDAWQRLVRLAAEPLRYSSRGIP